jgi:hypothetical protein
MAEGLSDIVDWIKESAHSKRLRNVKVLCPKRMLRMGEDEEKAAKRVRSYWDRDPVHMSREGYKQLAKILTEKVADIAADTDTPAAHQHNVPKQQQSKQVSWLARDDAVAHRADDHYRGGRGRGPHGHSSGWRGGRQFRGGGRRLWNSRGRRLRPY